MNKAFSEDKVQIHNKPGNNAYLHWPSEKSKDHIEIPSHWIQNGSQ